jgi:hypothetical protein
LPPVTETFEIVAETRPRRDVGTSRDRLETETSRPRPQPCYIEYVQLDQYQYITKNN